MTDKEINTIDAEQDPGTDLALMEARELADIRAEMAAEAALLSSNLTVSSNNISNGNKQFTLPDGTVMGSSMEVIILGHIKAHELYPEGVYNANKPEAPICMSKTKLGEEELPHASIEKPECDTCAECPNNQWGSKGQGKLCKEKYKVAVIVPAHDDSTVYTLSIAATAMKHFDASIGGIQTAYGVKGKNGEPDKKALPCEAIVTAEFMDQAYPLVKITGANARPNPAFAKHYSYSKGAIENLLK